MGKQKPQCFLEKFSGGNVSRNRGGSWVGAKASQVKAQGGQNHFQGGGGAKYPP